MYACESFFAANHVSVPGVIDRSNANHPGRTAIRPSRNVLLQKVFRTRRKMIAVSHVCSRQCFPIIESVSFVSKPVVLIAEELSPATMDVLVTDYEIRHTDGSDRDQLLPALADAEAVLVRSATTIDAEAIKAAKKLKVIARAGVGLDNVDTQAATEAGVMVVNAPTSNIISAAELTCGHILAAARHIAPANQSLKAGEWKRSA